MTFLGAPLATLGIAGAVGAATLVALYLLKMRRRRLEVPFAGLWAQVLRDTESTALWRRLRRLLSLLLQLAILATLVLAVGDPRLGVSRRGRTLAIVVDASASMQATDGEVATGGGTRLDEAKRAAHRLIDELGPEDQAMILRLDAHPAALTGLTSDERELRQAITALEADDTDADLNRALGLAGDALRGRAQPTTVLIGDGAGWQIAGPARPDLRYIPVGKTGENLAVTAFAVRRYRANQTAYEVLAELQNFGKEPATALFQLLQDGEVVESQRLELAAGQRIQRLYPNLAGAGSRLEARLQKDHGVDALPLDDHAFALLLPRKKIKVLVVTPGNMFLEGALFLDENLIFEKVKPADWNPALLARFDALIVDGFVPPEPPPIDTIYLDPHGAQSPFPIAGELSAPLVTEVADKHPVGRWLALRDLNISRASRFVLGPGDVAIASALRVPIIAARDKGGHKAVAIGFDLKKSDLPLRVAFPVLLVNSLEWFTGGDGALVQTFAAGQSWRLVAPPGIRTLTVHDPVGRVVDAPVFDGRASYVGRKIGFYEVRSDGAAARSLAAQLPEGESRIAPERELSVGGVVVPRPEPGRVGLRRALWPLLAVLAFLLLCLEWATYNRRVTV